MSWVVTAFLVYASISKLSAESGKFVVKYCSMAKLFDMPAFSFINQRITTVLQQGHFDDFFENKIASGKGWE